MLEDGGQRVLPQSRLRVESIGSEIGYAQLRRGGIDGWGRDGSVGETCTYVCLSYYARSTKPIRHNDARHKRANSNTALMNSVYKVMFIKHVVRADCKEHTN